MERLMDSVLEPFLEASSVVQAEECLQRLMEEIAAPLLERVLRGKFARLPRTVGVEWDYQDVYSTARTRLIVRLLRLRSDPGAERMTNFLAYVAKIGFAAWNDYAHARCPGLTKVRYRLQYLLENRTSEVGFALWEGVDGRVWCGFAAWGEREPDYSRGNARYALMAENPRVAARAAFPNEEPKRLKLPELVAGLLRWLGTPVELHTLAAAVAELLEVANLPLLAADADERERSAADPLDPQPSPSDAVKWREYLFWLAAEVARLPLRQRTAFLLHSTVTQDFELQGVLSVRQLATLLERPAEEVAGFWNDLPLHDLPIARLLGIERQRVINLRSVARARLGRRWRAWKDQS